ncbi:uncharacterized protein [Temnothorax nylanderi]|uniref:uncharacterized protein n=1 Tax=Temnothorax nylanderi TaxID=102681 RepID=UPI003A881272
MVDDNLEVPKKCGAEYINMELEKARKRIQERIKKARYEKETEAHVRENPGIIDKEDERPSDQYDMNVQFRSPDFSLVIPPSLIDEVDNTDDVTSVTTCQPRQRPVSALALDPKSSTFSCSSSVSSNQSATFSRSSSVASNQSATFSRSSSVASNKPLVTTSTVLNVQKILTAPSTANESNLDQDISLSSAGKYVLVLKTVLSKQEELSWNLKNVDHKLDLIMDLVRTAENVKKPEGWPTLPLRDMNSFYEWELFLQNGDNYDFAVSHFSVVAGRGVHEGEMATSICKKIFSPEVASQLNWTGAEIKKGIKSLKCGMCIIDACGKQYKGNFSRSKVTGYISTWLRSNSKRRAINNVDLPR